MRRKLLALGIVTAALTLVLPSAAQADHAWGNYHWARTSNPFTLKLDDNVTSAWDSYLNTASSDWSKSSVLNTTVVQGGFGSTRQCRPNTGEVEVCNDTYGNNGWLGIASISVRGGHITKSYVKLNDTYFNTATYNTPAWRAMVMCQEVGHAFGLDHQDENFTNPNLGTCMDYTNNPGTNQHPNQHDYNQLESIYAHLDSTSTVASADFGTTAEGPAAWGKPVRGKAGHGESLFVRDLGHGNYVFTFVIWAR